TLSDFTHSDSHRGFYWDMKNASETIKIHRDHIEDPEKQSLINYYLELFDTTILLRIPELRTSIIHNDANDYNVLVDTQYGFSLLDFGDMIHSCTVFELAIAIAYAILKKADPITAASHIIRGYHSIFPLTELEIELLFAMICTRLATSVSVSSYQQKIEPDSDYIRITEDDAWATLKILRDVHPHFAYYVFRDACQLSPCPNQQPVEEWLLSHRDTMSPVVKVPLTGEDVAVIDLSIGSLDLATPHDVTDFESFTEYLKLKIKQTSATVGLGRYNEARLIYTSDTYITEGLESQEKRTVHLGIDLFLKPGTSVLSPLDGIVHSFQDNANPLDYGPTVILEHRFESGRVMFYTLYGHLSRNSLDGLHVGKPIKKGESFATIGDHHENGGWPPHLHLQLILDPLNWTGDFPGVARQSQRGVWLSICPNPNLILQITKSCFPAELLSEEEILHQRSESIGSSLSISYKKPLKIVRGFMQYLYDENGQVYLDAVNNVPHVGHSNPRVVMALKKQAAVLNTNTRYLHDNLVRYAERLCSKLPEPLSVCFFVNSGSEANELALRLARTHTKMQDFITIEGAYHGNTQSMIDLSSYKHDGPGGSGAPDYVHKVRIPDPYRGEYRETDSDTGSKYAVDVAERIKDAQSRGRGIAGFLFEPLMGCGGQIVFPDGYLAEAFKHVRDAGGVCIADEVQIGFGRVGTHFWGFETQSVVPDIVTMGKPIGNGHPLAAVVTTPEIAASFDNGMEYFSTTGGNPVSCAVGLAVLEEIEEKQLQQNALEVGAHLKSRLTTMMEHYSLIGDVRGMGLFIGVELVLSRETLEPARDQARYIVERMKDRGVLISLDGPLHNVLKIKPPIVFTKENADYLVEQLDRILKEDMAQP
ncbi:MAG: aminotransferase class III-fold pyridoxal phosphate-dependent enzyme, partial [Candidatus Thorarchaeota archaeon]